MILLIGSTGYIGSEFKKQLIDNKIQFKTVSHSIVLTSEFKSYLNDVDILINASGYVGKPNVDKAEEEKDKCITGNILIPSKLVDYCKDKNIIYCHVSSGCIYDGCRKDGLPFNEIDKPNFNFKYNNCSFYSGTKAMAEEIIGNYEKNYIWRLRIPFDEEDNSRNYITKLLKYNKLINFENSITNRKEYVSACLQTINKNIPFGIYNIVNTNPITAKQVTELINEYLYRKSFQFFDNESDFYKIAAKTPRSNCILDNSKLLNYGINMKNSEESIIDTLKNWKSL